VANEMYAFADELGKAIDELQELLASETTK
jgi:hypothetical protein